MEVGWLKTVIETGGWGVALWLIVQTKRPRSNDTAKPPNGDLGNYQRSELLKGQDKILGTLDQMSKDMGKYASAHEHAAEDRTERILKAVRRKVS